MENDTINLIRPFYYSDSKIDQVKITKINGGRLVEINGDKYLELPLVKDKSLFIPAEGLVQIETK